MPERWRKPLNVVSIEHADYVVLLPDGRVQRDARIGVDSESMERILTGYACAKCLGVFEHAWPVLCPDCGAPIRERQAEYMAKHLEFDPLVDRLSTDDEIALMHETLAKEAD